MSNRVIELSDDSLIKFPDLPALIAEVKHDDEMAQAITRHLLEKELPERVADGTLRVRDSLTHGYIDHPEGYTLQNSVVALEDMGQLFKWYGVTLTLDGQGHDAAEADALEAAPVAGGDNGQGVPSVVGWTLNEPKRADPLSSMIYSVLKKAYNDKATKAPRAREVMDAIAAEKPLDFIELSSDEIKYYGSNGNVDTADIEAVRKRIARMTGR